MAELLNSNRLAGLRAVSRAVAEPRDSLWAALQSALPTPVKLYIDSVLAGKKGLITEADFSEAELRAIKELASAGSGGAVNYSTYDKVGGEVGMTGLMTPKGRVANSLGQFNYAVDPEGMTVTDQYDFNSIYKDQSVWHNIAAALGTAGLSPLHLLGERLLPPGQGRPVNIRLQSRFPNE